MLSLLLLLTSEATTSVPKGTQKPTTLPAAEATRDPREFMVGTPKPTVQFNCTVGIVANWPPAKTQWCCTYRKKGCPKAGAAPPSGKTYDCQTRELWIPPKVLWCCTYMRAGCPAVTTTPPTATTARSITFDPFGGSSPTSPPTQPPTALPPARPMPGVPPPTNIPTVRNNITGALCATCKMFCLDGFALGANGCPICQCNIGSLVFDCTEPTPWFTQQRVWCCSLFNICTPAGPTPVPRPGLLHQMCKLDAQAGQAGACAANLFCTPTGTRLPEGLEGYGKCVSSIPSVRSDDFPTPQVTQATVNPVGTTNPTTKPATVKPATTAKPATGTGTPKPASTVKPVNTATTVKPVTTTVKPATTVKPVTTATTVKPITTATTMPATTTVKPATVKPATVKPGTVKPATVKPATAKPVTTSPPPATPKPGDVTGSACKHGYNTRTVECAEPLTCVITSTIEDPSGDPTKRSFEGLCE